MNENIQALVNEVLKSVKPGRQYPVTKMQLRQLDELGLRAYMPAKFGYTDAAVVIDEATNAKSGVMNRYGEGEEIPASALYKALNG